MDTSQLKHWYILKNMSERWAYDYMNGAGKQLKPYNCISPSRHGESHLSLEWVGVHQKVFHCDEVSTVECGI